MSPSDDEPHPELPTPFDPRAMVDSLLSEAESRREQESEARRTAEERARSLNEQKTLRTRLEQTFDRAYAFHPEEKEVGRKPCSDGFRRWGDRFAELGVVMRECDEAIERLRLVERLRAVAERDAPAAMKFACALLLLASDGQADAVASALEKANIDGELRRFVYWLHFILDNLWRPFPGEDGINRFSLSPDGTSREENQQAEQALHWPQFDAFTGLADDIGDKKNEIEEEEIIVLSPETAALMQWEAITVVEGKFPPRWTHFLQMCEAWHVPVGNHNEVLSDIEIAWPDLIGEEADERALLTYLFRVHSIAPTKAKKMRLEELAKLMLDDCKKKPDQAGGKGDKGGNGDGDAPADSATGINPPRKPRKRKTDDDYRRDIVKVLDAKGYDITPQAIKNEISIQEAALYRVLKTIDGYTGKSR